VLKGIVRLHQILMSDRARQPPRRFRPFLLKAGALSNGQKAIYLGNAFSDISWKGANLAILRGNAIPS